MKVRPQMPDPGRRGRVSRCGPPDLPGRSQRLGLCSEIAITERQPRSPRRSDAPPPRSPRRADAPAQASRAPLPFAMALGLALPASTAARSTQGTQRALSNGRLATAPLLPSRGPGHVTCGGAGRTTARHRPRDRGATRVGSPDRGWS